MEMQNSRGGESMFVAALVKVYFVSDLQIRQIKVEELEHLSQLSERIHSTFYAK